MAKETKVWGDSAYHGKADVIAEHAPNAIQRIKAICDDFECYGYRRVTAQLRRDGWTVNHKRVARIMREQSLLVRPRRRFFQTTDSRHRGPFFPNLAAEFTSTGPNQLWVTDVTYIVSAPASSTWR